MEIDNILNDKDWVRNLKKYKVIEDYIFQIFQDTLRCIDSDIQFWKIPFFNTPFFENEENGNPIFSALNQQRNYIIKVIIDEEYSALTSWESEFNSIPLDVIYMNSNYLKEIKENFKEIILNHEKNILNFKNGK